MRCLSWRRQQKMDGCSRNVDLVHFGTQKMPGKIGYCLKSGLAQYSSFIITMGLSFARYHLTRGDDPNFCSLLSLLRVFYKSLRPPRPKIQFRRKLAKTLIWTFAIKKLKKIAEKLQKNHVLIQIKSWNFWPLFR